MCSRFFLEEEMKKRTLFNMHHGTSNCSNIGRLVPFLRMEIAPGDTVSGKVGMLVRMSPLNHPLLHDLYVDQYIFYVPHRLVDSNWEDFVAAGPNNGTTYKPTLIEGNPALWLTRPYTSPTTILYSPFPQGAYNLVYNEFFRDQDRQSPVAADYVWTQTGDIGTDGTAYISPKKHYWNLLRDELETGTGAYAEVQSGTPDYVNAEDILRAITEQKLQMKRATYGTRYVDILKSFGVSVNYQMLQRPELVAVSHGVINVTDVVATDSATGSTLGSTAGYGVLGNRIRMRRKSFPEHGTLLGVMVVRPPFVDPQMTDYLDVSTGYEAYYDPALEIMPPVSVTNAAFCRHAQNPTTEAGYVPWGAWYRTPTSRMREGLEAWGLAAWGLTAQQWESTDWQNIFFNSVNSGGTSDDLFADTTFGHFQVSAVNHLRFLRLIGDGVKALAAR